MSPSGMQYVMTMDNVRVTCFRRDGWNRMRAPRASQPRLSRKTRTSALSSVQ
ncbi:conserved hypothetical protein [Coccidioides posadasii str. Silveira]|uniref:Uncharacterized protein n=1 Tax=Coccidioides posadasii (strain RMSCC 757 / Silveira) TaxID=443226 RepID=E9CW00_COCPS|nr:conserved hypothetical protein [Coccidioides posadasii str. Silveira]